MRGGRAACAPRDDAYVCLFFFGAIAASSARSIPSGGQHAIDDNKARFFTQSVQNSNSMFWCGYMASWLVRLARRRYEGPGAHLGGVNGERGYRYQVCLQPSR